MTRDQRRMLLISYAYPPTGGGGVQRSVKFAKYLPRYDWRPTVLTAADPSVPVRDKDLSMELDPQTTVLRAKTLEPSYRTKQKLIATDDPSSISFKRWMKQCVRKAGMSLLQPDPQILWNPFAARLATQTLRQLPHDVVYVTGPPFSSFLLGRTLKRRFGLPLVLDFRDEWLLASQHFENHQRSGIAFRRQQVMLGKVLRAADAVVATTQASAEELAGQIQATGGRASVHCIYNGYDEDDLPALRPASNPSDRLRIVYTGTLWKLTDISPVVDALIQLAAADPDSASRIDLILAGRRTPHQDAIVAKLDATVVNVQRHDYLPHGQSLELAASADVLLLLLADEPGAERVVPAKLFEYLSLRKPILSVCGNGETASLIGQHGHSYRFSPDQTNRIAACLVTLLAERPVPSTGLDEDLSQFSRRRQTSQLAAVMDAVSR
ncbi:hypothetical protein Enr13x_07790 [Stieleria neptunia]|uniref:Glycosyltransferase subfamily 4-like N-terminal domain-containing protein n=2 Tax=Stieleria neptunia TaxID=2527979 RepID=A0A518HJD3_9BACT|nr:hypothetical protein Enr13x_07790 [Stieleria neptunia]